MALRPPLRRRAPAALTVVLAAFASLALGLADARAAGEIRVAVLERVATVELGGTPLDVRDLADRPLVAPAPTWFRVVARPEGVEARGVRIPVQEGLRVRSATGGAVRVNTRDYPGLVEIVRSGDALLVVNQLPFEDYVMGAVKAEAGEQAPLEMLKAQAIVARTYAAYHWRLNAGKAWHIVATTANQGYLGGVSADSPVRRAVRETDGQVLLWDGDLFPAFYHTDSGGYTEDPRTVFATPNMPALRPVRVEFPSESPYRVWTLDVPLADLTAMLGRGGIEVGPVVGLEVVERSESTRATRIAVRGTRGSVVVRGNDFRRLVGYDTLRSTLFAVAVDGGYARFAGRGYGHGVGMDQSSAKTMAQLGYGAAQILGYYYPGAQLGALR